MPQPPHDLFSQRRKLQPLQHCFPEDGEPPGGCPTVNSSNKQAQLTIERRVLSSAINVMIRLEEVTDLQPCMYGCFVVL